MTIEEYKKYIESYEFKNKDFIDIVNKITPLFHYQKVYLDLLIEKIKRESDTITEFEFNKSIWNFFKLQDSEYCVDGWLLNQEIVITKHKEIIEEDKKIEKIEMCTGGIMSFDSVENITTELKNKINELIDEINNLKEK